MKLPDKIFVKSALSFLMLFSVFFSLTGSVLAAAPKFNFMGNDVKTLRVGNWTTDGGSTNWKSSITANAGDRVAFDVYYHNGEEGTTANNTKIKITYPTSSVSTLVATSTLWADNATAVTDTATINISSSQTITFEGTAKWYENQQVSTFKSLNVSISGGYAEVNIGNIEGGWATQGHVVFYANISNGTTPPPVCTGSSCYPPHRPITPYVSVYAGPNASIDEDQSITFQSWATDSNDGMMSYSWVCSGGVLSSSNALRPTYYAPFVSSDTTFICTLTATNDYGSMASSSVKIFVRNGNNNNYSYSSVTTNNPENVTTTTAILKGTLVNDGGQSTSMRFNWGKVSSANTNTTYWTNGRSSGDVATYTVTGLEAGKAYQYKVEATSPNGNVFGQNVVFATKPEAPTNLIASPLSSSQVSLTWNKGAGSCYTKIVRKAYSYPTSIDDGTVAYYGSDRTFIDKNLTSSTAYYYKAWAVACDQGVISYSDLYSQAYAVTNYIRYPINPTPVETNQGMIIEFLARNTTQKENAWQDSVSANPEDEVEFYVVVTPTGTKSLDNVRLANILSVDIDSISDLQVDGKDYQGSVTSINIGTIPLGKSTVVAFKGHIAPKENFSYGKNTLTNSIEVSAANVDSITKTLNISVTRMLEAGAGISDFLNNSLGFCIIILSLIVVIMIVVIIYLIISGRKRK